MRTLHDPIRETATREYPHHAAGMLHHLIVLKINEQPHTGYSLSKAIEKSVGRKPSFGSIYPLLEHLREEGLVQMRIDGRKKIYTITKDGKALAEGFQKDHARMIDGLMKNSKMLCEITGQDPDMMVTLLERFKKGEDPLGPVSANVLLVRDTLLRMAIDGNIEKNKKKINAILKDAHRRLQHV